MCPPACAAVLRLNVPAPLAPSSGRSVLLLSPPGRPPSFLPSFRSAAAPRCQTPSVRPSVAPARCSGYLFPPLDLRPTKLSLVCFSLSPRKQQLDSVPSFFSLSLSSKECWDKAAAGGGSVGREGTEREILHGSLLPPLMYSRVQRWCDHSRRLSAALYRTTTVRHRDALYALQYTNTTLTPRNTSYLLAPSARRRPSPSPAP